MGGVQGGGSVRGVGEGDGGLGWVSRLIWVYTRLGIGWGRLADVKN